MSATRPDSKRPPRAGRFRPWPGLSSHRARAGLAALGVVITLAAAGCGQSGSSPSSAADNSSPAAATTGSPSDNSGSANTSGSSDNSGSSSATVPTSGIGTDIDAMEEDCTGVVQIPDACTTDEQQLELDAGTEQKLVPAGSAIHQDLGQLFNDALDVGEGPVPAQITADYQQLLADNQAAAG